LRSHIAARHSRVRRHVRNVAPALDAHRDELAFVDELRDERARPRHVQAPVVAQLGGGRDAQRARGDAQQFATRVSFVRRRLRQHVRGEDALGQVVAAFEVRTARRGDATGGEQHLERTLGVVPAPPRAVTAR
jgi:hypothetical protein